MALKAGDSLFWASGIDNTGLKRGSSEARGILANLTRQVTGMDVFAGLGVSAALVFSKITKDAYVMSRDFQTAMKEVQTISDAVRHNYEGFSESIIKLSTDIPESGTALAKAFYEVVSAGYDGAQGLELLEVASRGAVAGVTSTLIAVDGLTTILNAWKLQAEDSTNISDIMFRTVELGKITYDQLAGSISNVASIAAANGVAFDQVSGAIASLTKQGIPASEATTQIRQSILSLNEVLGDGWSKTMTYQEALKVLVERSGGSNTKLREMVGRVEAMNAVLALTGANAKMAASDLDAMRNSAGATERAFAIMVSSTDNQLKLLANNMVAKLKPVGDFLVDMMGGIAKGLNESFFNISNEFERAVTMHAGITDIMRRRKTDIEGYIATIETLSKKEKLTSEEATNLHIAEQALKILIPELTQIWDDNVTALENVRKAKEKLKDFDIELQKHQLRVVEAEIRLNEFQRQEAKRQHDQAIKDREEYYEKLRQIQAHATRDVEQYQGAKFTSGAHPTSYSVFPKAIEEELNRARQAYKSGQIDASEFARRKQEAVDIIVGSDKNLTDAEKKALIAFAESEKAMAELQLRQAELNKERERAIDIINGVATAEKSADMPTAKPQPKPQDYQKSFENIKEQLEVYKKYIQDLGSASDETRRLLAGMFLTPEEAKAKLEALKPLVAGNVELLKSINLTLAEITSEQAKKADELQQKWIEIQQSSNLDLKEYQKAIAGDKERELIALEEYFGELMSKFVEESAEYLNLMQKFQEQKQAVETKYLVRGIETEVANERKKFNERMNSDELRDWIEHLEAMQQKYKDNADALKLIDAALKDALEDQRDEWKKTIEETAKGFVQISGLISIMNSDAGRAISILGDMANAIGNMGDPIGVFTSVVGGIKNIIDLFKDSTSQLDEIMDTTRLHTEAVNTALREQNRLLNLTYGPARLTEMQQLLNMHKANAEWYRRQLQGDEKYYEIIEGIAKFRPGVLIPEGVYNILREWIDGFNEANAESRELIENIKEVMIGFASTEITDSIVEGFRAGEDAMESFTSRFEDLMQQAMIQTFRRDFIEQQAKTFYDNFASLAEGGLTPEEINNLRIQFQAIITAAQGGWQQLQEVLDAAGITFEGLGGQKGLAGAIAGISEETAGLLAGQFNAIRVNTVDMVHIAESMLLSTRAIEKNTEYNKHLESIDRKLTGIGSLMSSNVDMQRSAGNWF